MAKKSKRRGDDAATEAAEREPSSAAGAPEKSRRRGDDAATAAPEPEASVAAATAGADSGNGTPEGKKPKLKKRKKNKREQSPSAVSDAGAVAADESGKGCSDGEGAPVDAEVSACPRNGEDSNCPEVNIEENVILEKKKPKLKKQKKNKMEQSLSAVSNAGAVNADESGNGCTHGEGASGVAEVSRGPRNGDDSNCPEVNMAEKGIPEEKKPKLKKRKKNKREQSPSAMSDVGAVAADESGKGSSDGEGAPGDAQVGTCPRNGDDPDCPEVNIAEKGTPERKKPKLKKRKKNKMERSPSAVSDDGAVEADKSGNSCTERQGASGDAEVSVSPRKDFSKVNIADKGTTERKKPKLKKGKKNKQERSPSALSDANDVVADKSGNGSTNVEAELGDAEASMSPSNGENPDCSEINIAENSVEEKKGNKDNSQKPKLKKRKKNKQEQSPSAVSEANAAVMDKSGNSCTNDEGAPGDADVSMSPRNAEDPHFPEVNIAEDSVEGKQGNEDNSQKPKWKKRKKKRKGNQVAVTEAPSVDVRWTDSVGNMDVEVQRDLSEEEANKITKSMGSSICESEVTANNVSLTVSQGVESNAKEANKITKSMGSSICESEVTANNVSLTVSQGVESNAKVKASCLHARIDKSHFISKTSTSGGNHKEKVRDIYSPRGSLVRFQRKKLIILDLNGLLADINQDHHNAHMSHAKVRGKLVFKRPYHDDFLRFCFQNFELGIWSSRMKANVDSVVNILMRDLKQYLLFCWDLSKCTTTGRNTLENQHKPLVLKELKKLWNKEEPDLPWEQGEFSPSNTLLVDDSPYKALRNPLYTAIFPRPYSYHNKNDDSLGPGGDLRVYLENLAAADDVQRYVQEHPFGQPSITESDPHWNFYVQILNKVEKPAA